MQCEQCQNNLDAYVDGMLPTASRQAVEAHLSDCSICRAELAAIRRLLGVMQEAATIQPPPDLADAIRQQAEPAWHQRWFAGLVWPVWAPVSLVLLMLAGWFLWQPAPVDEPSEEQIAQALAEVQYALGVVNYAAGKTTLTLRELEGKFQPSQQLQAPVRTAGKATGKGLSRGLSLALVPLRRITSFGWRNSP